MSVENGALGPYDRFTGETMNEWFHALSRSGRQTVVAAAVFGFAALAWAGCGDASRTNHGSSGDGGDDGTGGAGGATTGIGGNGTGGGGTGGKGTGGGG